MVEQANAGGVTVIGRLGENDARVIKFPVMDILYEFPNAEIILLHQRPGDPAAYIVRNTEVKGNFLYWTVVSGDVAAEGNGQCELTASDNGVVVKSEIYKTRIETALDGSGTPPDPWQSWVDEVTEAAADAEAAAQTATEIVSEIHHLTAQAETLSPGSQATAAYDDGVLTIGVPEGEKGDTGATPNFSIGEVATGEPGTSASASITGTAENPVLNMTIPRGTPGMESVLTAENIGGNKYRMFIERV